MVKLKKNALFFKTHWKISVTLVTFYALFVCIPTLDAQYTGKDDGQGIVMADEVKSEKEILRKILANVLLKAEEKEKAHERLKLSVAGALSNENLEEFNRNININLLKDLKKNSAEGEKLVSNVFKFCSYMYGEIDKLSIKNEDKVRLKVRIDELKSSAGKFGLLVNRPGKDEVEHKNYRVLVISDELQVVVISVGFLDGIRTGLVMRTKRADDALLKVIAVRAYVCAAIVIEGELENISPGTLVEFSKSK